MACAFEDSKAVYHYKCMDVKTAQVTHGSLPWCSYEQKPHSHELTRAIKRLAFHDIHPDESTTAMDDDALRCEVIGTPISSIEAELRKRREALARGYARSCAPDYDVNRAEIRNTYTCHYMGEFADEKGRVGRHSSKSVSGSIYSCDMHGGGEISDQLMEDIKLAAYIRADGDAAKLDVDQFSCSIMSLPQ